MARMTAQSGPVGGGDGALTEHTGQWTRVWKSRNDEHEMTLERYRHALKVVKMR